ncbi:MAG TPA: tripartite tricarboxylate transporter substrate binding protein [Burkholderiales bacterium]|nr:tripartite tricarboxylate transporter substrate binding protein [Burkholderiales bacterium]
MIGRRALLAAALAVCAGGTFAQPYPSKPIRLIVPFTPGGSTDILGRAIGQKLAEALGQQVVIENRPGAGGSIGAEAAARAAPDGYTLLMGHIGTLAVNPTLYPKLGYDPLKGFAPVAWVARVTNVLVVNPAVPAQTVQELVRLAREQPGRLRYGSGGNGSAAHLATEYFKLRTQTDIVHVPYKGTGPAVTDLLGGQIEMMMTGAPAVMPHVKAGKLRALGVGNARRVESLPDLPTIAEAGVSGFEAIQWYGVVAPAGTPEAVIARLNAEINRALATPELKARLVAEGAEAAPTTPQAFGAFIAAEIERWRPVIQKAGLKAE